MEAWKEELYHHGILGQKWGVRRYQNYDGTRTSAGKKRERWNSKESVSKMSDDELREKTKRLTLENNYINQQKQNNTLTKKQASSGEKWIKGILVGAGTAAVAGLANKYARDLAGKATGYLILNGKEIFEKLKDNYKFWSNSD